MQTLSDRLGAMGLYGRLLQYALPYWRAFALAVVTLALFSATEPLFAALMKPMLDGSFVTKDPFVIKWVPILIVVLFFARGVAGFLSTYSMAWVGGRVVQDLRDDMFDHLLCLPAGFYDEHPSGNLISKVIYDVEQVAGAATDALTVLIRDTIIVFGLLGWMFYLNWKLSLVFFVVGPLISLSIYMVSKRFRKLGKNLQDSMGGITRVTGEAVNAYLVTKVFGGQKYESTQFHRATEVNRQMRMKWVSTDSLISIFVQLLMATALGVIIFAATSFASTDQTTVGGFVSFMMSMIMLLGPIKKLTNVNSTIQKGLAAAKSIFELLDRHSERDDGRQSIVRAEGDVQFENIVFRYDTSDDDVLKSVSLRVKPGKTVAIVGRSGSGKSTLVNLLPRFYEWQSGTIRIDGVDVRELSLASLRQQIALVSQNVVLFNDTVAKNIAYGMQDEKTREDVEQAARIAHAMEFIDNLPDGLDTIVGDNGVLLSGGQRQRLAIARAVLKDAPILILDEATSALDTESEQLIQEGLERLRQNRTTLVIAHRLSTIENADEIVVMEGGQIVEMGNHQTLLAQNGVYKKLHSLQFDDRRISDSGD